MQPTSGSKRVPTSLNPNESNKRRKRNPSEQDILPAESLFQCLPYEVIARIFGYLSRVDLLNFECMCKSHFPMTDRAWYVLRIKDHFHPERDWTIYKGNSRSNYLLSQAVVSYIQALPNSQFEPKQTVLKKMQIMREKFPPFEALVQLTLVPKWDKGISEELASELNKEPLLKIISTIYEFARKVYQLEHGGVEHGGGRGKTVRKNETIKEFEDKIEPRIYHLIEKEGMTYLSALTVWIFARYRLIAGEKHAFMPLLTDLSLLASRQGDTRGLEALKAEKGRFLLEQQVDFIDEKQNLDLANYQLIEQFTSRQTTQQEKEALWPKVQKLLKDANFTVPFKALYQVVNWYIDEQNWQEADRCLAHILDKEKPISVFTLEKVAYVKEQLGQLKEADALYDVILGKQKSIYYRVKHHLPNCFANQFQKEGNFLNIVPRALAVKIQLEKFEQANEYVEELFSKDRTGLDKKLLKGGFFVAIGSLQPGPFLSNLLLDCSKVKEAMGDRAGEAWFKNLLQLATVNEGDIEACRAIDPGLMESFYEVGDTYYCPTYLLFKAGTIQLKLQKVQEAEWCYDQYGQIQDHSSIGVEEVLCLASLKFQLQKWEEAAKWYQLALNRGEYRISEGIYINLIAAYMYSQQWTLALEVCNRAKKRYGNATPDLIIQQLSFIESQLKPDPVPVKPDSAPAVSPPSSSQSAAFMDTNPNDFYLFEFEDSFF